MKNCPLVNMEVVPMQDSSKQLGHQIVDIRLCAGAVL